MDIKTTRNNDIQYHIESNAVLGLRATFMQEPIFTYNEEEKLSKVIITTAYPEKDCEFKVPQIVLSDCSFSLDTTTLCDNYAGDIIDIGIDGKERVIGTQFATVVPYNMSIVCFANKFGIAKDLANRVFNMFSFEAKNLFSYNLGLNIMSVTKGNTSPYNTSGSNTYQSTVSVSGKLNWAGNATYKHSLYLQNIELLMRCCKNKKEMSEPYNKDDCFRM